MLFSNVLVALALTVAWPLVLLGLLAGSEWLERRTLVAEAIVPRRLRRMADKPPEVVEAIVLEETAHVVAEYWSATGRPASPVRAATAAGNGRPDPAATAPGITPPAAPPADAAPADAAPADADSGPRSGRHARRRGAAIGGRGRHERH
jgi:hypothetical protein